MFLNLTNKLLQRTKIEGVAHLNYYNGVVESTETYQHNIIRSIEENLGNIIHSSEIPLSRDIIDIIAQILIETLDREITDTTRETFKKTPKNLDENTHGEFNVLPSTSSTRHITETLVVYCLGNDNLNNRLLETILCVDKHRFKHVVFITSKWDASSLTGKNVLNLQSLIRFRHDYSTSFCFILVTTCGLNGIRVL